jgi:hypothetical protein
MRYLFASFIILLVIAFQSCKSPTAPVTNSSPDTTSQNFTWQKYYFGVNTFNHLDDVAIVNDTSIWAVGSVFLNDSTGNIEGEQHNAIHWDGNNWNIERIEFYTICGQAHKTSYKGRTISKLNDTTIWISAAGNQIASMNGNIQTSVDCLPFDMVINKIWVENNNSVYAVGINGSIAHYSNSKWLKIESGTDMSIMDIWGAKNPQTGSSEILAVASYYDTSVNRKILQINGNTATTISSNGINWDLHSIWFKPQSHYFVVGSGIYDKNLLTENTWSNQYFNITNYNANCIRGNDTNDIVVVGSFGEVLHYNGKRWRSFRDETGLPNGEYLSVVIKDNKIIAVGYDGLKAVILVGKR